MEHRSAMVLVKPRVKPLLDPRFSPGVLANRAYLSLVEASGGGRSVGLAIEQADGSIFHFFTKLLPLGHPQAAATFPYFERYLKFLLWSRGGHRLHIQGADALAVEVETHFRNTPTGRFDANIIAERIFDNPLSVVAVKELPPARARTTPLGRHLDGCRIGFDLGGSDRKVAAVIDGKVVFSEETVWDPYPQADPQYHYDGIVDSLRKAALHLPRVDAIGGSAAGVYVNNRVKVASLFRGVPADLFERRVRNMFLDLRRQWNDVPFEVVNDGEVTALAGSLALGDNGVLGIALGTSTAAGYVTSQGDITSWLNELAFVPIDYHPDAPADEWSQDRGCGVQYFSQQAVGRLCAPAGIPVEPGLSLPEQLKQVQALMQVGDERARRIYQTIGVYLGYGLAHFAEFYDFKHVLVLGRVTSGPGGDLMIEVAREVLRAEFPELAERMNFHVPDEKDKRHGQAIAAASLPTISAG